MKKSRKPSPSGRIPTEEANRSGADGPSSSLDMEDRVFLLWKDYRKLIIAVVVVFFGLLIGYQSVGYLDERGEAGVREAFRSVTDAESRLAFAQEHAGHPLSGLAYLELASEEYESGDFADAAAHYEAAIEPLGESPLSGRAKLGYAVTVIRSEDVDSGEQLLRSIVEDGSQLDGTRAEAAYHLAILYWSRGDFAEVKKHLEQIEELERPGFWMTKAEGLRTTIPELRVMEDEVGEAVAEEGES